MGVSAGPAQSISVNCARQQRLSSLGRAVRLGKWSGSVETMLCSSWGRGRVCCQATSSAALVPMAVSTSAEAGLLQEHPTRGCWGPQCCPEPGGHAAAMQGDGAVSPPCLPGSGAGKWVLFFLFPPPQIARCPPYRWGLCRPGVGQCCSGTGPCCPVCGEELQLWLTAPMGGMSNALAFIWVSPSSVAICHTQLDN